MKKGVAHDELGFTMTNPAAESYMHGLCARQKDKSAARCSPHKDQASDQLSDKLQDHSQLSDFISRKVWEWSGNKIRPQFSFPGLVSYPYHVHQVSTVSRILVHLKLSPFGAEWYQITQYWGTHGGIVVCGQP